jgi:hypothetical protein
MAAQAWTTAEESVNAERSAERWTRLAHSSW